MFGATENPVLHLELHTANLARACAFYTKLFAWRAERIRTCWGDYLALDFGGGIDGGVTECDASHPLWLPYVEVSDIAGAIERGRLLGASVLLESREGPAGWRCVLDVPSGGQIALWQPKR